MADQVLGIAPQKNTHANWVSANPTLGKDAGGKSYGQIILSTASPVGDILVWGNDQTYNVAYAAGQYSQVQFPTRSGVLAKSANYTMLDTDPDICEVNTGATDVTITLPTLADNTGRRIKVVKVDSGAGKVTVGGEGAETIDGVTTIDIDSQYDMAVIEAGATCWNLEQYKDHVPIADSAPNYNRVIYRYSSGRMVVAGYVTTSAAVGFTTATFGVTFTKINSMVCSMDSAGVSGYAMEKYKSLSDLYLYQSHNEAQKIRYIVEGSWR